MILSVVITLVGTGILLAFGPDGVNVATVLAIPVAIFATMVTVGVSRSKRSIDVVEITDAVIVDLARKVLQRERVALGRMLGEPGEASPARMELRQPHLVYWRTDGGDKRSSSDEIADYYANLDRGRLVIVGEPGSGKSVLATCLCIDLAGKSIDQPTTAAVPVRLSLLTFNPAGIPHDQPGEVAAELLGAWIVQYLTEVYGIAPELSARLVAEHRVLPVLDGLDEMDANLYRLVRATELVRALNHPAVGKMPPFVLTSRRDCFDRLTKPSEDDDPVPIQHATVVSLEPLRTPDVISYLRRRFPDPAAPHRLHPRWRPVATALRAAGDTPLKQALSVPLYLFLLTAAYRTESSNPAEILDLEAVDAIRDRLYELLIAAGVERNSHTASVYPELTVNQATTWLENLAESMITWTYVGESRTEIEVSRIHRIAGRLPGRLAALLTTIATLPLQVLLWRQLDFFFSCLASLILVMMITTLWRGGTTVTMRFSVAQFMRWLRRPSNVGHFLMLLISLVVALLAEGRLSNIGHGSYILFTFSLLLGGPNEMIRAFRSPTRASKNGLAALFQRIGAARTTQLVRSSILATFVNLAIVGTLFSPFMHFGESLTHVSMGLLIPVTGAIALSPWPIYALASMTFVFSRRFAARPARFLDWAQEAGLVGIYGDVLRFRHREFQAWLVKRRISIELSTSTLAERLRI